jgi:DNA polymerase III sliding clamp (beta) subunit (PCNA family)
MTTISIELSVADLKSVLPGLSKIVSKKNSLPVLDCVKAILRPDQSVCLQANNLDECVTVRLSTPGKGTPGEILVPLNELTAIAKRAAETVALISDGKETKLVLTTNGAAIEKSVTCISANKFLPMFEVNAEALALDDPFKQAIKEAFECASEDEMRYIINGACLDTSKKEAHYVVATDGHHLYSANSFLFDLPTPVVVPNRKFISWPGFMQDGPWFLRFQPENKKGDALFRIDSDHWTYVAKPIAGNFPNWKQLVPIEPGASRIVLGEEGTKAILNAIPLLPGNDLPNRPVSLEIAEKGALLKARIGDTGRWNVIPIPATVSGPLVSISMNRDYLVKALRFGCNEIDISDSLSPFSCTTKGKLLLISPLRPDNPVSTVAQPPSTPQDTSAASPSTAEVQSKTEPERTTEPMPAKTEPMTAPTRGNLTGQSPETDTSSMEEVIQHIGLVRDELKKVLDDMTGLEKLVRKAAKEQRATDKEMSRARTALRSLQSFEL